MSVVAQADGGTRVPLVEVCITGRMEFARLPAARAVLDLVVRLRPDQLVIDLAECTGIDAAAIALLLDVHRDLLRAGSSLTLRAPSPRLRRILAIARVTNVLYIVPEATPPGPQEAERGPATGRERAALTPQVAVAGGDSA